MSQAVAEMVMPKRNDASVKIDVEAISIARIAAGIKNMHLVEYLSELVKIHATREVDEWAAARGAEVAKKPKK